jgi:hypothetical protein
VVSLPKEMYPPQIDFIPSLTFKRRFRCSGAISSTGFRLADGHNQFTVATTSILGNCYLDMWRISKIEMWTTLNSSGGTVSILPVAVDSNLNFYNEKIKEISDSSVSVDKPAHVVFKTNKNTPVGSWHWSTTANSTGILFNFVCPAETIMDIQFEGVLNLTGIPNGYTRALSLATAGTLYAAAINSTTMTPVGINST